MKIGVLGGAFNPPHIGHLTLAQDISEILSLDKVFFIPTNISPYKEALEADAKLRLEMAKLATFGNKKFEVLDLEIKREGVSFTIDTIRELKKKFPEDEFYLIVGSDLTETLSTWRNYQDLKKEVKIVVGKRREYPLDDNEFYHTVNIRQIEASSSQIRELVKNGCSIRHLVTENVAKYIQQHELYKM
ncbi:MAG: nicotinate (nicotinamide) nucleotide adenylyltransferase [Candidatus Omnitrophota bacterium]